MARNSQTFDSRLRTAVAASGYSQRELAAAAGINRSTLFNWINGRCRPASFADVDRLAVELGVSPRVLVG